MRSLLPLVAVLIFATATRAQDAEFRVAFPNLHFTQPLYLAPAPDGSDRLFVVEQPGRVWSFPNRADATKDDAQLVLDIEHQVLDRGNEEGLLGLAFSPDFEKTRAVFLHYSADKPRRNVLSRWAMDGSATRILPGSEEVVLEVEQPYSNHNGGMIDFGPDGYLYVSLGDGGSGGDPLNSGQRLDTLLGKILRIDVTDVPDGQPYAIPADNPFVDQPDARPEIYAYGLRNVWRFSFDPKTGRLWGGDVGQNAYEEIDIITKGGNYGWNVREGLHPFRKGQDGQKQPGMIDPVLEYNRQAGISVTGGYVYRGQAIPELDGAYFFGDFGSGKVWYLREEDGRATASHSLGRVPTIASFGLDKDRELYITSFDGRIYKLVPKR